MPRGTPFRTLIVAAVALAALPASSQMRAGPARGGWAAPFAPASPAVLGGIQSLLATPAGVKLAAELPSVQGLGTLSAASEADLRVVGALSAHLLPDFSARPAAAQAEALAGAYRAAVPEVERAVEARAKQVAVAVAYGQLEGKEIVVAAAELERFGVYGTGAQDRARIVRRLASQNLMEGAQRIASDFLRAQRSAEDAAPRAEGPRKPVPEAWKLRAYQKAAAAEPPVRPVPPAPEPKAKPMSADLYERLGAAKGMTPAELKAAFERTAELHRPERYLDRDARSLIALTMAHRNVEAAYAVLGDPAKRADYDRGGLREKGPPAPNPLADDFYERLGATRGMSEAEVKSAYRRAAAAFHPDKARSKGDALGKAMTKAFQDIGAAYEVLGDPAKRAAYDKKTASRR